MGIDSFNDVRNTPDKRIKEDFEGEDQSYHESESEDVTTEEDEEPDSVFVKPTKPAPRKKIVSKTISEINSESHKINELNQLSCDESPNCNAFQELEDIQDEGTNVKMESHLLEISSSSANSSFEDLTKT